MHFKTTYHYLKSNSFSIAFSILFLFCTADVIAQNPVYFPVSPTDSSVKKKIQIIKTDSLIFETLELGRYRKLIGNIVLKHDNAFMYCDSAVIDIDANYMTAFGRQIHIEKGDSIDIWGDFLEYFGDQKLARLNSNCTLRDNTMVLTTPELTYNLDTDVGSYFSGGKVVNKETTITSAIGYYYHSSSMAAFYGDVVLKDTTRTIYADSLKYDTNKEIAYFITKTIIIDRDSNVIETNGGYYDTKKEKAFLSGNAKIHREDALVLADKIDYDNSTKIAIAQGNVVYSDSSERTTILSNYIYSDENNSYIIAYKNPLMISVSEDGKDTMFLSADTLVSFKTKIEDTLISRDSVKVLKAFHHMKMIQGEMSAVADSLFYSEADSIFKLYHEPILWMDSTQITGDSIFLYNSNKEINKVGVFGNAFIIHLQDTTIYNQIKGKYIEAIIVDKKIEKVYVDGNAESIYYIKEDDGYTGANKSTSGNISVSFRDDEVYRIKLTNAPEAEFTPMKKINPDAFNLNGFIWHWNKKPFTKYDVIRDKNQYENYINGQQQNIMTKVLK